MLIEMKNKISNLKLIAKDNNNMLSKERRIDAKKLINSIGIDLDLLEIEVRERVY